MFASSHTYVRLQPNIRKQAPLYHTSGTSVPHIRQFCTVDSRIICRNIWWSLASTTYGVCPSPVLPNLDGVDDVLPEDITARADGGEGIKIGIGHPDGEGGVLLS